MPPADTPFEIVLDPVGKEPSRMSNANMGDEAMPTDRSNQPYEETQVAPNVFVRVTTIQRIFTGGPGKRIQLRNPDGRLSQGPEIPDESIDEVVRALSGGA
jgi:hypothetical protein